MTEVCLLGLAWGRPSPEGMACCHPSMGLIQMSGLPDNEMTIWPRCPTQGALVFSWYQSWPFLWSLLYEASERLILSGNRSGRERIFDYILDRRSHSYAGTASTAGTGLHSVSSSDECPELFLLCHLPVGSCEMLALVKGPLQFVWKLKLEHSGLMPSHFTLYQGGQCTQIPHEPFHHQGGQCLAVFLLIPVVNHSVHR